MGDLFQPTHLLIIAVILLVLFGAKRLPELGKGLGAGWKEFKEGLKGGSEPPPAAAPAQPAQNVQQLNAASAPPIPAQPVSTPVEPK